MGAGARPHVRSRSVDPVRRGQFGRRPQASIAALPPNGPAFQPGFEDADTSVTGAVVLNGSLGSYWDQGPESSPLGHARPDAPPLFIAHGDLDPLVPASDIRKVAEQLRRASSNAVVHAELRGGHHAFDLYHSLRFEAVVAAIEAFTAWARSPERTPRP